MGNATLLQQWQDTNGISQFRDFFVRRRAIDIKYSNTTANNANITINHEILVIGTICLPFVTQRRCLEDNSVENWIRDANFNELRF